MKELLFCKYLAVFLPRFQGYVFNYKKMQRAEQRDFLIVKNSHKFRILFILIYSLSRRAGFDIWTITHVIIFYILFRPSLKLLHREFFVICARVFLMILMIHKGKAEHSQDIPWPF